MSEVKIINPEQPNSIEEAKKLIEADKKERGEKFKQALDDLCKEYKCALDIELRLQGDTILKGLIVVPLDL